MCECAYCSIAHGLLALRRVSLLNVWSSRIDWLVRVGFFNVVVSGLRWWWCFFSARGMDMFGSCGSVFGSVVAILNRGKLFWVQRVRGESLCRYWDCYVCAVSESKKGSGAACTIAPLPSLG